MIRWTLTLPDRMISRRATQPGFKLEAALITVFGLLGTVGLGLVGMEALGSYGGNEETLRIEFIGAALRPFGALVALWIGYTLIGHLSAGIYGGRGPASRLFRGAAWSLIPIGIWFALRSIVIYVLFQDVEYTDPEGFSASEHFQYFMDEALNDPIYAGFLLLGVLFAVWSGHLFSKAIEQAKDIPLDDARKIAAIPAGVVALYLIWSAIGRAGIL